MENAKPNSNNQEEKQYRVTRGNHKLNGICQNILTKSLLLIIYYYSPPL